MKEFETWTERQLQAWVVRRARENGWAPRYHTRDSRGSDKGFPDLVLVRPPRFVLAELKTEVGRLRPEQKLWGEALRLCPAVEYYLWRPSDLKSIEAVLKKPRRLSRGRVWDQPPKGP